MSEKQPVDAGGGGGGPKAGGEQKHVPGDGIRSLKTSAAFRTLNFELYAKPNKWIMGIGLAGIVGAAGFLFYMNYMAYDKRQYYEGLNEDGSITIRPKKRRWD